MSAVDILPLVPAFAILVCVPLTLRAVGPGGSSGRVLIAAYPVAAIFGAVSILVPAGVVAALLAIPWLLFTAVAALHGVTRALATWRRVEQLCIAVGFMYLSIGGAWFVIWRSGIPVLGFGAHVPLLTAIHFHFAGFASPILVGFVGRELRAGASRAWPVYAAAAVLVLIGPALVALGIAGVRPVESPAAAILAVGTATAALLGLAILTRRIRTTAARALLAISFGSAVVAMTLALMYAVGNPLAVSAIGLEDMVRWHGSLNALGYVSCGLLAWNVSRQ